METTFTIIMSVIFKNILFIGSQGEKNLYTLFDSGANLSCIHPDVVSELAQLESLGRIRKIATAAEGHFIEVQHRITVDFELNDVLLSDEFLVVPSLSEQAIIGAATMQKWRIKLDFEYDSVHVDPRVAKMMLKVM